MRTDPKQKKQEQIVELLQKIDSDYNWFGIAGRLLKTFNCELICFALKKLTDETNQNIKSMIPNENKIVPYLYTIAKSWKLDYLSFEQKEEDKKTAKPFFSSTNMFTPIWGWEPDWRVESQRRLKFLRQKLELVHGEKRKEVKKEIGYIENKLENIKG